MNNILKISIISSFLLGVILPQSVNAQGLTPLKKNWRIANDKKIFQLTLINAYPEEMKYELSAEDKKTKENLSDIKFTARKGRIAAKRQRKVLVYVPVNDASREVRICLRFPAMEDDIRVRVCGDYSFVRTTASIS